MTAEHKYEMTISLQIVEHLGLNLYSNTSAVISEAVANAWDADAKTVEITLEKDCITIKDDGCGMDTDDINNKYLTVGYQKRHLVPITPMLNRKVMGRKGIGKLSLLSIAETITIYSSKNGQKNALQISTQNSVRQYHKHRHITQKKLTTAELISKETEQKLYSQT